TATDLPQQFSTAEAQIAARRKDYAKAAALARIPSQNVLVDPPSVVIDAFLQEGDWQAAADIAKQDDPRRRPRVPRLDDDRARQYVELYQQLAITAAWAGNDAAASEFLGRA